MLVAALRKAAAASGALFRVGEPAVGFDAGERGVTVRTEAGERVHADAAVLCAGIWGAPVAALTGLEMPVFPVAHPYVYDAPAHHRPGPFVRWPEHHVYARVHGDRLGIGSYDHVPIGVDQRQITAGALLPWRAEFSQVIESAQRLLRPDARFAPEQRLNGVFAMTPDNLPFLGRHPAAPNVWVAQALWVTHAAGAAHRLADALLSDGDLPIELGVDRFAGVEAETLRDRAMALYRDIYANDAGSPAGQTP